MPGSRRRDGAPGARGARPARTPRQRPDGCPGAWRRHDAADGALARFRPVGGAVSVDELKVLIGAAVVGGSPLEITSRGSVQVRGLDPRTADDLADALRSAAPGALLDPQGRDVPCGVLASPRSGSLDAAARTVADGLRGRDDVPGRLLVALDDGSGDVAAVGSDVTVRSPGVGSGGAHLLLDGVDTGLRHPDPAALALAAVDTFLAVRGEGWRLAEVDDGVARVAAGVRERLDLGDRLGDHRSDEDPTPHRTDPRPSGDHADRPRLGLDPATGILEVLPRLGELTAPLVGVLTALDGGRATLRVTPWRTLVLRDLTDPEDALDRLTGRVETDEASRWAGLSACVGAPRCAKSHTDVRADLAGAVASGHAGGLLHAHWVGCHRACGTPGGRVAVVEALPTRTYRTTVRAGRVTP